MKRIPDSKMLEFDKSFIKGQMGGYSTNEKGIRIAKEILHEIIARELTPRQRQIIRMKYYDELSVTQIADKLNLDTSTVSRTLTRARAVIYRFMRYYIKYLYTLSDDD